MVGMEIYIYNLSTKKQKEKDHYISSQWADTQWHWKQPSALKSQL